LKNGIFLTFLAFEMFTSSDASRKAYKESPGPDKDESLQGITAYVQGQWQNRYSKPMVRN
jgi:hypothetical protein